MAFSQNKLGSKKLVPKVKEKFNIDVSERTLQRNNALLGLRRGKPKKVPAKSSSHIKKRLEWCKNNKEIDWMPYIFSDEKTFYGGNAQGPVLYEKGSRPTVPVHQQEIKVNVWWGAV